MPGIILKKSHLDIMIGHCRSNLPNEACGIVAGRGNVSETVYVLRNMDMSPVSYSFDPLEQQAALNDIAKSGRNMLAIFHSHPSSPAYPSSIDIKRSYFPCTNEPNWPGALYIIVGMSESKHIIKAYVIGSTGVSEAGLEIQ